MLPRRGSRPGAAAGHGGCRRWCTARPMVEEIHGVVPEEALPTMEECCGGSPAVHEGPRGLCCSEGEGATTKELRMVGGLGAWQEEREMGNSGV